LDGGVDEVGFKKEDIFGEGDDGDGGIWFSDDRGFLLVVIDDGFTRDGGGLYFDGVDA